MVWRMDDKGMVDLFLHSLKLNIGFDPFLYFDHNLVEIMVNPVAF